MKRGEIRWYTFRPPDKRRPVLLLTRNAVIEQLSEIVAAPVTRTVRGPATELVLTSDDGMPVACAANFDHVGLAHRRADRRASCRILHGLLRRLTHVDAVRVQDIRLRGANDVAVLTRAAAEGRVLLTHDVSTLIGRAVERIRVRQTCARSRKTR
jgi:mRNA-degrading endonuclease toxin of MazEF toxin-antitoxin module